MRLSSKEAAAALGGQVWSARSLLAPGPGHGPRDRSLSVTLDPDAADGFTCHSFAGDDWRLCREHVRAALGIDCGQPGTLAERRKPADQPDPDEAARIKVALKLWDDCLDPRGTVVERYLAWRRLELDCRALASIGFHPRLKYDDGTASGIVCLMRDLRTNQPVGVHRTFLRPDGTKFDRRMLGRARGAAIKLDPDDEVTLGLVVSEGVESALVARILGYRPTWALGSAGAIANLPVLPGVEALTILGEADEANAKAARECARRWLAAGAEVSRLEPIDGGDANDVLREVAK